MMVYLVVSDKKSFVLSERLFSSIEKYMDDHYVDEHDYNKSRQLMESYEYLQLREVECDLIPGDACESASIPLFTGKRNLEDVIAQLQ